MLIKLVSAFLSVSLLIGCAIPTKEEVGDKWIGKNISEAIGKLGPPQFTTSLPGDITIYTWEQQYGSANAIRRSTGRTGLHVNKGGIIVDASQLSESLLCR